MSSKQPRKQRKNLYSAAMHRRQKLVGAALSDKLREEHKKRSLPVKKGDTVEVMRGDFRDHKGKVIKVDLKSGRISVEGVAVQKAGGSERFYPVHPSNVRIIKAEKRGKK
jgi:large subunit ribosomal protein L24